MHTILKKLTSLVLVAFMVLSMVPIVAVTANAATGDTYQLVTDASTLAVGDTIIIVASGSNVALSTTQNGNNRGQASISKSTVTNENDTIARVDGVQEITLAEGTKTGTFAFNVDNGYLCAASNSKNYLRTQTTNDDNGSWTITISGGVATVKAQGTYTRNWLQYNKSSSIFSCYSAAQQSISIYKKVTQSGTVCEHTNTEPIGEAKDATCTVDGITAGKKCSNCGKILEEQAIIPATGHTFENGTCRVCGVKQPTGFTINRDSFGEASGYAWHGWSATATTGETISGYGYIYGTTTSSIQMNPSKTGYHIYNTTELPGKITSITLTAASGTPCDFYVLTSDTSFNQTTPSTEGATTKNVTTSGATWEFTTTDRYFAIVVTGGAAYLSSIEITYEACSHENTVNVDAVPATCTETGYTAGVYCNACGTYISGHEIIEALGQSLDEGEITKDATCTEAGEKTFTCTVCGATETQVVDAVGHNWLGWTETKAPTCTTTGVQTGTCSRCGETKTVEIPTTDHTYVDGTCSVCGATKTETTNRYYIATIRTTGNYFYMTNELVGTNTMRYMAVDSGLTTLPEKIAAPEANKVFVLVDNGDGTYYIYAEGRTGDNYLGWASENSGAFVAEEAAKRLTKTDNDDGTYSFYFNDGTKDRYLSLNENTGSDFFAWYAGTQKQNLVLIPVEGEAATPAEKNPIVKWNITLEDNLKVNFHLELNEGEQVYLKVGSAEVAYNLSDLTKTDDGYYVATVSMAAAQMTDDINVQVINLTNEKLLANKTYSIRGYADAVLGSEKYPETTKALVNEMLNYGGAAQAFFGYNTGNLANAGITGAGANPVPESVASDMNKTNDSDGCITFYGASLVYRDKIAVRYYFNAKEGQNLTFMADGQEREPVLTGGHYMIEVPDICPQNYAAQITVTVTNAEGHSATVSYGPMSYIVRMYYKEGATTEMKNLLQALYNYHLAAKAYIKAQNP